ncbi:phosphocholine cytidylyltransferase family protein [bacterium]|nr:phosphocholine cytidylyltransferase family protein [bacterium]
MAVGKNLWKNAVMLVAGKGDRLKPHTHNQPKPLTEVGGVPILENALTNLADFGVESVTLVTGYLNEKLMNFARAHASGMEIIEIFSPDYASTNNIVSLALARRELEKGCLILEGDVFFEKELLHRLKDADSKHSYWLADRFTSENDGCMLTTNSDGIVQELEIVRDKRPENLNRRYKSVGILALTPDTGKNVADWLEQDIARGRVNVYYDLVLADRLPEAQWHILDIHGTRWFEIDDEADLAAAEKLFAAVAKDIREDTR